MRLSNAVIHTVSHGVIENGYVEIEAGRIVAVGAAGELQASAECEDMHGAHILPGLVDAHTCLGLKEDSLRYEGNDWNEPDKPLSPQLCAWDGFNPEDRAVRYALQGGVTSVAVAPGNVNLAGGCVSAVKLRRDCREAMLLRRVCALKVSLGEASKNRKLGPCTRMAQMTMLRNLFDEAACCLRQGKVPLRLRQVADAIEGRIPVYFHAHRADDIMAAVSFAEQYHLRPVIVHAADAVLVADALAAHGVPVVAGSLILTPSSYEDRNQDLTAPAKLDEAGVRFAITTDHHQSPIQMLGVCAALAVRDGLRPEAALRAVTLTPAEIMGVADRIGSIEVGKDADLLVVRGDPLKYSSRIERVLIDGMPVKLD